MKKILCTLVMVAVPAVAFAAVPQYDVEKFCEGLAKGKAAIYNACISMEQKSYDDLKKRWAKIPDKTKEFCGNIAKGMNSYQSFIECEKLEKKAAKNKKSFKR